MSDKLKCSDCPREKVALDKYKTALVMREANAESSSLLMDDAIALEAVKLVNQMNLFPGVTVTPDLLRQLTVSGFDIAQELEEAYTKQREVDKQFCVGALTMRAKTPHTEFTVTVCQSPNQDKSMPGDVEPVVVQRKAVD